MTKNEIITELLTYDGWEIEPLNHLIYYQKIESAICVSSCSTTKDEQFTNSKILGAYITDLNILHRVAVKVYNEFRVLSDMPKDFHDVRFKLYYSLLQPPINGEYIQLATATAEAIVYLKSHKP
jgi:hypothetical protein